MKHGYADNGFRIEGAPGRLPDQEQLVETGRGKQHSITFPTFRRKYWPPRGGKLLP